MRQEITANRFSSIVTDGKEMTHTDKISCGDFPLIVLHSTYFPFLTGTRPIPHVPGPVAFYGPVKHCFCTGPKRPELGKLLHELRATGYGSQGHWITGRPCVLVTLLKYQYTQQMLEITDFQKTVLGILFHWSPLHCWTVKLVLHYAEMFDIVNSWECIKPLPVLTSNATVISFSGPRSYHIGGLWIACLEANMNKLFYRLDTNWQCALEPKVKALTITLSFLFGYISW